MKLNVGDFAPTCGARISSLRGIAGNDADVLRLNSKCFAHFSQEVFDRLRPFQPRMEGHYPFMVRSMEEHAWIESYREVDGVALVLRQMAKRVNFDTNWNKAGEVLEAHYEGLNEDFLQFFPEIKKAVEKRFNIRLTISGN